VHIVGERDPGTPYRPRSSRSVFEVIADETCERGASFAAAPMSRPGSLVITTVRSASSVPAISAS